MEGLCDSKEELLKTMGRSNKKDKGNFSMSKKVYNLDHIHYCIGVDEELLHSWLLRLPLK